MSEIDRSTGPQCVCSPRDAWPFLIALLISTSLAILPGCQRSAAQRPAAEPPAVKLAVPVEQEIPEEVEFTGRTDAVESVEIRARVSGYLNRINFKPGKEVAAGDLLFEIDPRPYETEVARTSGSKATIEARLKQAQAELERTESLRKKGVSTQADFDLAVANQAEASAQVAAANASLQKAQLDLEFTRVTAPIAGRTGRELLTVGNLVAADTSLLTTIVSTDPIFVYFDVDERTVLEIQRRIREGNLPSARERTDVPIRMALANETGFPHHGVIDLVNNRIDAGTGTIQVRGRFPNADHKLMPGFFVRVRYQIGPPQKRLLIPERAIGQQQGNRYVFVVNSEMKAERREIQVGQQKGTERVVLEGLQPGERIIVAGQHRVRPGMTVREATETDSGSAAMKSEPHAKSKAVPSATSSSATPPAEPVAAPKADATPTAETGSATAPKTETPQTEAPKTEAPKSEAPQTESPKAEATPAPKAEDAKAEARQE